MHRHGSLPPQQAVVDIGLPVQAYTARRLQQAVVQAIPNAVDVDLEFDAHTTANVQNVANDIGAGIANGVLLVRRAMGACAHAQATCSYVFRLQVNLQHNGITATSVSLQSTVAAVPTSSTTCPAGAISGICIGARLNKTFSVQALQAIIPPKNFFCVWFDAL